MSISIPSLDDFTYQAPKNPIPGVSYVGRKKIKLSNVDTDNQLNKKARVDGVVNNHVNALKESFAGGIDTSAPLPVVEQGELENHLSVDFFHRSKAFEELGITEYVFDVYEFADEFSKISFEANIEKFLPNKSINEIIFVIFIPSTSSSVSALFKDSVASDHECPILETKILGSRLTCK